MADSPREDGALCLGVGCWVMNCGGLPAVLRLMIGRSLSVSGNNSFLGLRGLVGPTEVGVSRVPCVPFARTGPGSRVCPSVLEMTCRWASHRTWRFPSILAGHPVNEQLMMNAAASLCCWPGSGAMAAAAAVAMLAALSLSLSLRAAEASPRPGDAELGEAARDDNSELSW